MKTEDLKWLLEKHDREHLECDGAARVFSWILKKNDVPHTVMLGRLEYRSVDQDEPRIVEPHYWIELEDGSTIDFKAQMWLPGKEGVPHGLFKVIDYPQVLYVGEETKLLVTSVIFNELLSHGFSI